MADTPPSSNLSFFDYVVSGQSPTFFETRAHTFEYSCKYLDCNTMGELGQHNALIMNMRNETESKIYDKK